jgi:hypothetical protein
MKERRSTPMETTSFFDMFRMDFEMIRIQEVFYK